MNSTKIMQQYILIKPNHLQSRNIHEFQALRSLENNPNLLKNVTHMHVCSNSNIPVTESKKHGEKIGGKHPKTSSMVRRNARERRRVKMINMGYETLRTHIPTGSENRKLSKVDTLRAAVDYIKQLQLLLEATDPDNGSKDSNFVSAPSGNQAPASARTSSHSPDLSPTLTEDISDDEDNDENVFLGEKESDSDEVTCLPFRSAAMPSGHLHASAIHSESNIGALNMAQTSPNGSNVNTVWAASMQQTTTCMASVPTAMTFGTNTLPVLSSLSTNSGPIPSVMFASQDLLTPSVGTTNTDFQQQQHQDGSLSQSFLLNQASRSFTKEEKVFVDIAEWLCKTNSLQNGQIRLEDLES